MSATHLPPVGATLTREQLVAGLRSVFQRTSAELDRDGGSQDAYVLDIAGVLDDVAREFGLNAWEREEILGDLVHAIGGA